MKKILTSIIASMMLVAPIHAQIQRTTVAQGEIEGKIHDGYALYKAIPFAEAPVGRPALEGSCTKETLEGCLQS